MHSKMYAKFYNTAMYVMHDMEKERPDLVLLCAYRDEERACGVLTACKDCGQSSL